LSFLPSPGCFLLSLLYSNQTYQQSRGLIRETGWVQPVLLWSRSVASPSTSKERAEQLGVHVVDHRVVRKIELGVRQRAEAFAQAGHGGELLNGFS